MDDNLQASMASDTVVLRQALSEADRPAPKGAFSSPGRVIAWALTLVACVLGLAGVAVYTTDRLQTDLLLSSSDSEARERLGAVWPSSASGEYYEALGELAEGLVPENIEMAQLAAERAVAADPTRAFAWARLAYFTSLTADAPTDETIAALGSSMDHCALCDQELVRWRFNFVLSHWNDMPEDLRSRAFTQADMLRWSGANAEFLAEMRVKANRAGIPYDAYRSAVDTPVRSWDIEPVEAVAATAPVNPAQPGEPVD